MEIVFPLRSAFLAIPLEGEALMEFHRLQEHLKGYEDCLRLQNPASPHLTLMYWPSLMEIELRHIVEQSEKIARKTEKFDLVVNGTATFGGQGRDRVVFLSVHFSPELASLKKMCPWTDGREFSPHITLARIKHPERFSIAKKKIMKPLKGAEFSVHVDRLKLYGEIGGKKQAPIRDFIFP